MGKYSYKKRKSVRKQSFKKRRGGNSSPMVASLNAAFKNQNKDGDGVVKPSEIATLANTHSEEQSDIRKGQEEKKQENLARAKEITRQREKKNKTIDPITEEPNKENTTEEPNKENTSPELDAYNSFITELTSAQTDDNVKQILNTNTFIMETVQKVTLHNTKGDWKTIELTQNT
tara:strand:- start:340 stop:864 length:525 start_codon:yes stop_codon:yes gene_type:complete